MNLQFLCAFCLCLAFLIGEAGAQKVIVIDPGHGGKDYTGSDSAKNLSSPNNATSPSGLKEKDLTLELSVLIVNAINQDPAVKAKGISAELTRTKDENPNFTERAKLVASHKPLALVSIHFNASDNHKTLGTLAMIAAKDRNPDYANELAFADGLAQACSDAVRQFLPASKKRSTISDGHLHNGRGSYFFHQMSLLPELAQTVKCAW
jgi:N-acetylmuramoyl-L-alanine amidase